MMQTRITARHGEAPDGLRAHIEQALGKLERVFDGIHGARVVLDGAPGPAADKQAEIALTLRRQTLTARGAAPSHHEAVDACVRQLRRQVSRYKEKLRSHKGRGTPRP